METADLAHALPALDVRVSVIIPCWNDAAALSTALGAISRLNGLAEIIVADASEQPECAELARSFHAKLARCDAPNRGQQMNAGAALATGDILLFHHADSILTQFHIDSLIRTMRAGRAIGGAFHRKFDARHPLFRWIEPLVRWRAGRGGTLYGDQSIFIRREDFRRLGGFANLPLMEDVEFSKRLWRAGHVVVLDPPMTSSSRRHDRRGALRMSLLNGLLLLLHKLGVPPARLHRIYYGGKSPGRIV